MKKYNRRNARKSLAFFAVFVLWTAAVSIVDVQPIGPRGSEVGFASLNGFVHDLTGVHTALYTVTDWLGLVPLCTAIGFACLGLVQWVRRKKLSKVDRSILVLGGFYVAVMAAYLFFEQVVVNYRPVLIEGVLEASYPSSTTMLVLTVMPTAILQFNARLKTAAHRRCAVVAVLVFMVFMVVGRLVSGVHWVSDIIGGALLSGALVMMYRSLAE